MCQWLPVLGSAGEEEEEERAAAPVALSGVNPEIVVKTQRSVSETL